jgi:AcrR family transcriptional regulator
MNATSQRLKNTEREVSLPVEPDRQGDAQDGVRPPSPKAALTRQRLLDAAKEVFEEDGFFDARISDISARAALSHGTFYTYFSSKPEIFREVALKVEEALGAPMSTVILDRSSTAVPRDRLRNAIRLYLERYRDEAKIMGVIEQVARHDPVLQAARVEHQAAERALVASSIGDLQRHGMVDPNLNPEIVSDILGSMMGRFPEMWLTEGRLDCDFDDGVEHLTIIFINALQLDGGGSPP